MISIIIPSFNDGDNVINLISQLEKNASFDLNKNEIIIVESGDSNYFEKIDLSINNIRLLVGKKGRARQLKQGAEIAKGDTLIFLHADSSIEHINFESLDNYSSWACFKIKFRSNNFYYRFIEFTSNFRSRYLHIPFGDQGIVISKQLYKRSGGYTNDMVYEDIDFAKKLKRIEKNNIIEQVISTDARRFEKHGRIFTHLIMSLIFYSYLLGFIGIAKKMYSLIK